MKLWKLFWNFVHVAQCTIDYKKTPYLCVFCLRWEKLLFILKLNCQAAAYPVNVPLCVLKFSLYCL